VKKSGRTWEEPVRVGELGNGGTIFRYPSHELTALERKRKRTIEGLGGVIDIQDLGKVSHRAGGRQGDYLAKMKKKEIS